MTTTQAPAPTDATATAGALSVGIVTAHMSFDEHGGSNYSRHRVAQELEARGHDVTIYTLNWADENHVPVPHDYDLVETRVDSHTVIDGVARFIPKIRGYVQAHDVIHVYVPGIIPLFGLYRQVTGNETPVVATLNGYTPFCTNTTIMADGCWQDCTLRDKLAHAEMPPQGEFTPGSAARFAFNDLATVPLMNRLDAYFCLSPIVADIYADVGVRDDLLRVCPNMADSTFAHAAGDAETDDGTVRILYAGRVDAMKRVGNLLTAVSLMDAEGFHVDIVGDNALDYGQDLAGYRDDAASLGVDDRVTFHGWVDYTELSHHYARAALFVHPAEWPEPFGRTILEALQHDLPVVCADAGAPPWVSGSAGVSYPKRDVAALAATLDELVTDDEQRARLAANAAVERERFDPDTVVRQIEATYREVLRS